MRSTYLSQSVLYQLSLASLTRALPVTTKKLQDTYVYSNDETLSALTTLQQDSKRESSLQFCTKEMHSKLYDLDLLVSSYKFAAMQMTKNQGGDPSPHQACACWCQPPKQNLHLPTPSLPTAD